MGMAIAIDPFQVVYYIYTHIYIYIYSSFLSGGLQSPDLGHGHLGSGAPNYILGDF